MKTQVNIKIDGNVKEQAQKQAKRLGLSLSSVVNATLSQFARTGTLELSTAPRMTPYLESLVAQARRDHEAGRSVGPFDSADEMIKSLES